MFYIFILSLRQRSSYFFFFFNDTATTEIYTLSLHDALPIYAGRHARQARIDGGLQGAIDEGALRRSEEHTSESSHGYISYAGFCLKKKKKKKIYTDEPRKSYSYIQTSSR